MVIISTFKSFYYSTSTLLPVLEKMKKKKETCLKLYLVQIQSSAQRNFCHSFLPLKLMVIAACLNCGRTQPRDPLDLSHWHWSDQSCDWSLPGSLVLWITSQHLILVLCKLGKIWDWLWHTIRLTTSSCFPGWLLAFLSLAGQVAGERWLVDVGGRRRDVFSVAGLWGDCGHSASSPARSENCSVSS